MSAAKSKKKNKKFSSIPSFPFLSFLNQSQLSSARLGKCKEGDQQSGFLSFVHSILFPISSFSTCLLLNFLSIFLNQRKPRPAVAILRWDETTRNSIASISLSNHATILEFYWNGCFGKSTLSRGLPSWFQRHFFKSEYTPKGLVELRKHEEFDPDSVDWYDQEWEKYQSLMDGLDEKESAVLKETYLGQEDYILFPEEAFFLLFAVDVLEIRDERTLQFFQVQECWSLFRNHSLLRFKHDSSLESIPTSALSNDFAVQYAVYHHFRSKGWTPRSGLNLGFDLLLYKKGPQYTHAEFCVWIVPKNCAVDSRQLIGKVRVASNVKKRVILCFVEIPQDLTSYQCLDQFVIHELKLARWIPDKSIDQSPRSKK